MKTDRLKNIILIKVIVLITISCIQDDNFNIPDLIFEEPIISGNVITIDAIAGMLAQAQNNGDDTFTFEDTNTYISGYVISSDEAGNFFEELIIQDALENPTRGIKLLIDINPLFARYEIGRKLFIKLDGLTIGTTNGVFTIGIRDGNTIGQIAASLENEVIQRSTERGELVPLTIELDRLNNNLTNLYVTLQNAQFNRSEVLISNPLTYASEPIDQFDGERTLESCNSNLPIVFSTSTFADFRGLELPAQRGAINGILTKNFFGDTFNFVVNTPADVNFENPERCDSIEIDCGLADTQGTANLFEDDFENQRTRQLISGNGWTNFIQEGTEAFEAFRSSGASPSLGVSARIGSRNSGDVSSIAWLITPRIDFDVQDRETLRFMTSNSFANESNLELLFSRDWDGIETNITTATWINLPAAFIVEDSDFFGDWFDSGIIDLSCIEGMIHIAFRYTGNGDSAFDGIYELDEITIDYQ